jgi:RHS repeat-associated protein
MLSNFCLPPVEHSRGTIPIQAAGNATTFSYDGNGNLLRVTDANSHATAYSYDSMDRLLLRTDPLGNTENYQYDAEGNLSQFTDRRGKITTSTYDSLNRKTLAGFGAVIGTPTTYDSTIAYSYDAGNRVSSVVDSATGTISHTFDKLNRLIAELSPQGTVSYTYDAAGRKTQMTVAGQAGVNYAYDNGDRIIQITQGSGTVSFAYDGRNRRTSLTLPNGIVMSYSYDDSSQLTGITYTNGSTTLGTLTYAYDLAGRRTQMGGSYAQIGLPVGVSEAEYNANNQLTEWGTASLYYDANGNMTSDGVNSFNWNARNQMSSMNSSSVSFQYDPYGRRAGKTVAGVTTSYLYDGANITQEISGGSPIANLLSGGIDEVFTRTDSSDTANFLTDALGSTINLTNSSGSSLAQYAYEPFGNTTVTSGSSANPYEYTGRENDGTGLYFYRARYYNPSLQRFVSQDPIEFLGGSSNLYPYASNSPTYITDSSGRCPWCAAAAAGAILGVGGQAITDLTTGQFSGWGAYGGAAVGGAVAGWVVSTTGNPYLAGAAGGMAGNLVKQGINNVTGKQNGADTGGFITDTLVGGATGVIPEAAATANGVAGEIQKGIPAATAGAVAAAAIPSDASPDNNGSIAGRKK